MSVRSTFLQDRGGLSRAVGRAGRHLHWARHEGIGRLIDEDQANPADRLRLAASKARWRSANPVAAGSAVAVFLQMSANLLLLQREFKLKLAYNQPAA